MSNVIAKPFYLTIDTIATKLISNRDNVFTLGDSVELHISIVENGQPKNITDTKMRLLMANNNSNPLEQVNDIVIVDSLKGLIKIKLESYMVAHLGQCLFQLVIEDLDECLSCQRFVFNCIDGLSSQVILEAQDGLSTLASLNEEIDNYSIALRDIKQHVEDVSLEVDNELVGVSEKLKTIDNNIIALDNKLNGVTEDIGKLPQNISLTPFQVQGSSIIYLGTPQVKMSALDLLKCRFTVSASGCCLNDSTVQSAIGTLYFHMGTVNNVPTIYMYLDTISDRAVQGKTLNMSAVFSDGGTTIPASASTFKIYIKSNISSNLNYLSSVNGSLSSIANNLKF